MGSDPVPAPIQNQSNPSTANTDRRLALQSGAGVTGDNSTAYSSEINNSDEAIKYMAAQGSDTVQALANAGRDIIKSSGGAIVDLARFQGAQNTESFNSVVTMGGRLIDKMLDGVEAGNGLALKVVDSFTPSDNKELSNTKYLYIAAAVVAGAVLLQKGK